MKYFGDDEHMGELGAILQRWAKLSDTPAPGTPPPNPKAKLEQQLDSPVSAREPIVDTRGILADLVAMDNEVIGLFLFGVFVGFVAYAFVALIS